VTTPAVAFDRVSRFFGDVRAVHDVSLAVAPGEFFSMLGPSGSGKTTCLRLIAGFDQPTRGSILIHGAPAAGLPPYERDVNTVFQDYALFPHLDVEENVGYGLMVRRTPADERGRRIAAALELVRLSGYERRRPGELSGGQRQRVALARALINQPSVLLLDEPLGALDLKLREEMQVELKQLQRKVGITFIYVTHDQQEALSMSDRVAVFNHGRIEQVGTPQEIYDRPATAFVARFVGGANVLGASEGQACSGTGGTFAIRPEKARLVAPDEGPREGWCFVDGEVVALQFLGATVRYQLALPGGTVFSVLRAHGEHGEDGGNEVRPGTRVRAGWQRADMHPLPDEPPAGKQP
jgi:putative spermidine/putrescine transport system ATP-binding protein